MISIQYRAIVAIVFQMVVIRHTQEIPVVTDPKAPLWQKTHPWFVVGFECMHTRLSYITLFPEAALVDVHYVVWPDLAHPDWCNRSASVVPTDRIRGSGRGSLP